MPLQLFYLILVKCMVIIYSKELFTALYSPRNSIAISIRANVNFIVYEYETGNVNSIVWIPGKVNIPDAGTKTDSPLTQE